MYPSNQQLLNKACFKPTLNYRLKKMKCQIILFVCYTHGH